MRSKYDLSLENIGNLTLYLDGEETDELLEEAYKEDFDNLRELIDNYEKLEKPTYVLKANNIGTKELEDFINDTSIYYAQPLPPFEIENIELEKYKKALDIAIDIIYSQDVMYPRTKEDIKEFIYKVSEK